MNRFIYATALASFVALNTQGAFADTVTPDAATVAAPVAADAANGTGPVAQQSASATPAAAAHRGRVRHAARIPGTFALSGTETSSENDAREQQAWLRVQLPALSGDGGG